MYIYVLIHISIYIIESWRSFLIMGLADIMRLHVYLGGIFTDLHGHRVFPQFAVSDVTESWFQHTKTGKTQIRVTICCHYIYN